MKRKHTKLNGVWAYIRSGTAETLALQRLSIEAYLMRRHCLSLKETIEVHVIDGSLGIRSSAALKYLMNAAASGEMRHLVIHGPDRLSRGFGTCTHILREFTQCGVAVHFAAIRDYLAPGSLARISEK